MRDMFDAGDDLGPASLEGFDLDGTVDENADAEEEAEGDLPRVVLATFGDLGLPLLAGSPDLHDRPIWFLSDEHDPLVGVFERYPEERASGSEVVMSALRRFSHDRSADLQLLIGPTNRLRLGFHATASLAEVAESFEDDGFDVLLGIRGGEVDV